MTSSCVCVDGGGCGCVLVCVCVCVCVCMSLSWWSVEEMSYTHFEYMSHVRSASNDRPRGVSCDNVAKPIKL